MNIWILKPISSYAKPWRPAYDKHFGFVVRAATEAEARNFAHAEAGDENSTVKGVFPWLDSNYTTCEILTPDGSAGIVLADFNAA